MVHAVFYVYGYDAFSVHNFSGILNLYLYDGLCSFYIYGLNV